MKLEAPIGHTVRLVRSFDDTAAPQTVGFGTHLRLRGRLVLWALISLATVGSAILLFLLWTSDEPWWFVVIFTVMPVLFLGGCALALRDSGRLLRSEASLAQRWAQTREHATFTEGRVTERDVALLDSGGVSSFVLAVTSEAGALVHARWHRSNPENRDETLLQTQIPAIGSKVRIWCVGMPDDDAPVVVDALDASVVR